VYLAAEELDVAVHERVDGAEVLLGVFQGDDGRRVRCHDRRVEDGGAARCGAP